MNESEYKKLKDRVAAEYKRKLEAIETVWQMSAENKPERPEPEVNGARRPRVGSARRKAGKGAVLRAVREAIATMRGEFTSKDIKMAIESESPSIATNMKKASLWTALRKLEERGEIETVKPGVGRSPNTYRKGKAQMGGT